MLLDCVAETQFEAQEQQGPADAVVQSIKGDVFGSH